MIDSILDKLEISLSELKDWLSELLGDLSPTIKDKVIDYLLRNPKYLLPFLRGDVSLEEVFSAELDPLPDTEIEYRMPDSMLRQWADDDDLASLVVFGGLTLFLAVEFIERRKLKRKQSDGEGVRTHRRQRPKNFRSLDP
ncbi:hypothetical protein HKX42_03310 [Salinisphaera sp. USBA-960]|nr:hypothetical protein [Salifodinibacter halophilus]NNC25907.1 hypothetical protein [Salifodinibacter halophilus]